MHQVWHSVWLLLLFSGVALAQLPSSGQAPIVPASPPEAEALQSNLVEEVDPLLSDTLLTEQFWFTRGAMLGWSKGHNFPPYVRVPIANGPTVSTENSQSDGLFLQGANGEAGLWIGTDRRYGAELGGLFVFQGGKRNGPDGFIDAKGTQAGLFTTEARTRFFTGDANGLRRIVSRTDLRVDVLLGYRFAYLSEDATVAIELPTTGFGLLRYNDRADTKNQFHGGQVGLAMRYERDGWAVDATAKLAIGSVRTEGAIIGSSRALLEYGQNTKSTELLRSLTAVRDEFAFMPSLSLRFSKKITEHGRMYLGYDLLYLNTVSRPDSVLGGANAPSGPTWSRSTTDYWLQGASMGMEWRY
jgi:hypothetical protein